MTMTTATNPGGLHNDCPDPIIGLEHLRKHYFEPEMSKCAFYGGGGRSGFVHTLPVIQVGLRKRGVRKSDLMRALAERTTSPRHIAA